MFILTHWHVQQSVPLLFKGKSLESVYGHSSLTYRLSFSLQEKDILLYDDATFMRARSRIT